MKLIQKKKELNYETYSKGKLIQELAPLFVFSTLLTKLTTKITSVIGYHTYLQTKESDILSLISITQGHEPRVLYTLYTCSALS